MNRRCGRRFKVIFATELDAKLALAERVWKDKGEVDYIPCDYPCRAAGYKKHYHLTSQKQSN
jgi:hypothetical protein